MYKISLHFHDLLFNAYICDLFYDIDDLNFDSLKELLIKYLTGLKRFFLKGMLINVT